jgi:hypothetical protein
MKDAHYYYYYVNTNETKKINITISAPSNYLNCCPPRKSPPE